MVDIPFAHTLNLERVLNKFSFIWSEKMISSRFHIFKAIIILQGFLISEVVSGPIRNVDPIQAYPEGILFEVKRDGESVGQHTVQFDQKENGQILAVSRLNITIKVLGMILYQYAYHCQSWWAENHLIKLLAKQDDNGILSEVEINADANVLRIDGPNGISTGQFSLYPSNHWHPGVLREHQVIDTLKGELANVNIKNLGVKKITAEGRSIDAYKYIYSGDVNATAWYDKLGRWVKLSFAVEDGSIIEYVCIECGLRKI